MDENYLASKISIILKYPDFRSSNPCEVLNKILNQYISKTSKFSLLLIIIIITNYSSFISASNIDNNIVTNSEKYSAEGGRFLQDQGLYSNLLFDGFFKQFENQTIPGGYPVFINESNSMNNFEFKTVTEFSFLDETISKSFSFDFNENLKKFLGAFAQYDINTLASDKAYKAFIDANYKKRTIVIGLDGLVQSCIDFGKLSAFKFLIENGVFSDNTRSSTQGYSGPGWSALLCSLKSKATGIINNNWHAPWINQEYRNNYNYSTPLNGFDIPFPCLFDELKSKKKLYTSKMKTSKFTNYFYSSWSFFRENFSNKAYPNAFDIFADCKIQTTNQKYFEYINCDYYSLDRSKIFVLQDFDLYFWYFASLDVAGHIYGFCSTEYLLRLESINNILMNFFDFLKKLNILDKINFIITSDHGADKNKREHGGDKWDGSLLVPLFMMGPDFKKNYSINSPISLIDIAPTIMKINNLPQHEVWTGKPINEALNINEAVIKSVSQPIVLINGCFSIKLTYSIYLLLILLLFLN